jgi:hypothetical protein
MPVSAELPEPWSELSMLQAVIAKIPPPIRSNSLRGKKFLRDHDAGGIRAGAVGQVMPQSLATSLRSVRKSHGENSYDQ